MKTLWISFFALTIGIVPAFAQQSSADQPTKEQVVQFLDLMQTRQRMQQMMDGMKDAQKKGAEEGFKEMIPNATPEILAKVDAITDEAFRDMPISEMFDAMVPIYQRHLTSADLDAIITFYHSPAGQKLLNEQPAMMAEGMQAGQDIMLKRLPDILNRLKMRIEELAKEEKANREHSAAPAPEK